MKRNRHSITDAYKRISNNYFTYLKKSGKPLSLYLPQPISVDSWSRFYVLGLRGISKE